MTNKASSSGLEFHIHPVRADFPSLFYVEQDILTNASAPCFLMLCVYAACPYQHQ